MSILRCLALAMIVTLTTLASVRADDAPAITLKVGDPAPPLKVAAWVKGTPVAKLDKGQIYVVEFWATWCGPCRATIPHLSELQKQHKDVVFIGMDCFEDDRAGVERFVKEMGEKMDYRVGLDDGKEGTTATAWMLAAGQNSIPTAFVIDKESKVAWIGHPGAIEQPLKSIIAGTFDPKREALTQDYINQLRKAMRLGDKQKIESICDAFIQAVPERADVVSRLRFSLAAQQNDVKAANEQAAIFAVAAKDDAAGLNDLAWAMVDPERPITGIDVDLALKMSMRAVELSKSENFTMLDTAARANFLKGDIVKALDLQTLAIAKATDAKVKVELKGRLDQYTAAKAAVK